MESLTNYSYSGYRAFFHIHIRTTFSHFVGAIDVVFYFKGPLCRIYGNLLAEMGYRIIKYIFISIITCSYELSGFVSLELAQKDNKQG